MEYLMDILTVINDGQELVGRLIPTLRQQGWEVVQSFNLQTARQAHSHCTCPNHGTDKCNCQMAVFLVYGVDDDPITLVFHSRDGQCDLSIVDEPSQPAARRLAHSLRVAFLPSGCQPI